MCSRHGRAGHARRRRGAWRAPSRDDLVAFLEQRQRDLEEEIADIHDLLRRLRDEGAGAAAGPASPRPAG